MNAQTAVRWIRDALTSRDLVEHLTHYLIKDQKIYASNGRLTAGHPFPWDGSPVLVPGAEFERTLLKLNPDRELEFSLEGSFFHLKSGRLKAKFRMMDSDLWGYAESLTPLTNSVEIPARLLDSLQILRTFISDNATKPWATCVGFVAPYLLATNNVSLAAIFLSEDESTAPPLLPIWALDFLLKRIEGLERWVWTENSITFGWNNGALVQAVGVNDTFPKNVLTILSNGFKHHEDPVGNLPVKITEDFRDVFSRIAGLTDSPEMMIYPDRIEGGNNQTFLVEEETVWEEWVGAAKIDPKYLAPVIEHASHWDPSRYPAPIPFEGPDRMIGLIMGRA